MIITRTVTERIHIAGEKLADALGVPTEYLGTLPPKKIAEYIYDYTSDGDTSLFDGADITSFSYHVTK